MLTSDFDFTFPEGQIALHPAPRGEARMMVVAKRGRLPDDFPMPVEKEGWAFGQTRDLIQILKPGDALALNDTKVLRARLHGRLETGAACEVLLLKPRSNSGLNAAAIWECLAKPGRKLTPGKHVEFAPDFSAKVIEILPEGERVLRFNLGGEGFFEKLERIGEIPLPPYIQRPLENADAETYQSIFAEHPGSVAAPTASLHFSPEMLAGAESIGVHIAKLTLHVGAATFRPVQTENAEDHPMHSEACSLSRESADVLNETRKLGGRIFAVGTTAARVLETCHDPAGFIRAQSGETRLFIRPGYSWKVVDALFTNFHWPRSTLFMLVCGLIGMERAQAAYAEAIRRGFRLFSYGDAMLIL
jgi:S-adenosylmethionine:tRNA ribosyltransferase-isomerase